MKATSTAGIFAMVRRHEATARMNGSFGACNFVGGFLFELIGSTPGIAATPLRRSPLAIMGERATAAPRGWLYQTL
ncbi:MAG: hypothetical protein ACREDV_11285 [Methylocella sp.]